MSTKRISAGVAHTVPKDVREILTTTSGVLDLWEGVTPLARNEWICWIISAKKEDTRKKRIERMCEDLLKGKRRPCCWAGCMHRK